MCVHAGVRRLCGDAGHAPVQRSALRFGHRLFDGQNNGRWMMYLLILQYAAAVVRQYLIRLDRTRLDRPTD